VDVDRWVVPPAVAAAVFALAAVSPPVSTADLQRGLRVEAVTAADGVILVRASVERVSDGALTAPRSLTVEHGGATVTARPVEGTTAVTAVIPTRVRGGRAQLTVVADELRATLSLPVAPAPAAPAPTADGPIAVAVAEGHLLPEVAGTVLVRAPGATAARIEPQLEGVTVSPARAAVGPCDVASFEVTVAGMGAPVTVVVTLVGGAEARAHLRLPLQPGGVALARDGRSLTVRGAFAGQTVHLVGGGASGARWWSAVRLAADDVCPRAAVTLPEGITWVRASPDALFHDAEAPSLRWDKTPPACAADPRARRWYEARTPAPSGPDVGLALDGGARARRTLAVRVGRARSLAWLGLAVSVAAEVALMLGLGLRGVTENVDGMRTLRRADVGRIATAAVILALIGFALALASSRAVTG